MTEVQAVNAVPASYDSRKAPCRTTVREAVKILAAIGRVRAQKGGALYVADGGGHARG